MARDGSHSSKQRNGAVAGKRPVVGSAEDVKRCKQRLEWALEAGNGGVWDLDIKTGVVWLSPEMYEVYGVEPGIDMTASNVLSLVYEDDQKRVERHYSAGGGTGDQAAQYEFRINHSALGLRWMETRSKVVYGAAGRAEHILGITFDITERKKTDEELKASEQRFRFLAESVPQKIFSALPNGKVDYFNPQWMEYSGLNFAKIRGWGWQKLIHPEDVDYNVARWRYSIKTGEPFAFEHRIRRHDGQYRWHITRAHAMHDEQGRIVRWIGSNTDVHDIKLSLQREHDLKAKALALAEQRTQLIELNKAKDEFISLASHQLRTPATGVKQYLGMLLEGYAGDLTYAQQGMIERANNSNERQLLVVNDLLRVARVDAGKIALQKRHTNVILLVKDIITEQQSLFAARQQEVIVTGGNKDSIALIDADRMRMALENIINNASKYTPPYKKITVKLSQVGGKILVAVKDEGVGIDRDDMGKLFRKFSRLNNELSVQVGGSGLGLYLAKKIVDLHGGSIEVTSVPGKGTTFVIAIPC